jgi:flagellar hook-associated protein 3 FlgL
MTVSTVALFQSALLNIENNQTQLATLSNQAGSQKVSQSLAGYGDQMGQLTSLNSTASRLTSYINGTQALSDKLATQNTALTAVNTAAQSATTAINEALANNSASSLMDTLQAQMSAAASALNTQVNGQYLFSGGNVNTPPVGNSDLSSMNTAADVTNAFQNGQTPSVSRIDANTTVQTGMLASDVGSPLFSALQAVQAYNAGPNGPLSGTLTADQSTFLNGVVAQFNTALASTTNSVAANGVVANQVSTAQTSLTDQQTALTGVIGNITNTDEAAVSNQIQLATTALSVSTEVFQGLQSASLLTVLGTSNA